MKYDNGDDDLDGDDDYEERFADAGDGFMGGGLGV